MNMNFKKLATDAAVLKAVTEAVEMAGRRRQQARRQKMRAQKLAGITEALGKTVEGLTTTAGKTVEGIGATAGKTVEGIGTTVGKTVDGISTTAAKTVGALGEAVEKTVETAVHTTKDATVGRVGEMRTQRKMAKIAKRKAKIRKQRMDSIGMWLGFGLIAALLYWWDQRRDKSLQGVTSQAKQAFRSASETVGRTAQQVAPKVGTATTDAFRSAKETVTRTAQTVGTRASEQAGHLTDEAKRRLSAGRGMDGEGNGHSKSDASSTGTANANTQSTPTKPASSPASTAKPKIGSETGGSATTRAATTGASGVTTPGGALGGDATGGAQGGTAAESPAGTSDLSEMLGGRSEVSAPGELLGATGPAISNGMKVVGFDGVDVGRVQEVEDEYFILDRPKGSDLRVPKDALARVEGTVAYLRVAANRVVQQGWESAGNS